MRRILLGQILLIICFIFYLIWWYRGFRPGVAPATRVQGINGLLLALTVLFGVAGIAFSLMPGSVATLRIDPTLILTVGVGSYVILLLLTRFIFHRTVTSELLLIVAWTMLEVWVIDWLNGAAALSDDSFSIMLAVIAVAFFSSMVLYVAYYRMEEMKAFYTAMVPLATGIVTMGLLVGIVIGT